MASRIEIRFQVPGQMAFARMWNNVEHAADDLSPAFRKMADEFLANNRETFDKQGVPRWKPLAAGTIKDRARHGYGPTPILVRSGLLKRSLTEKGAPDQILEIKPQSMTIGTSVRYAMYHQTGNLKSDNYPVGTHPPKRSPLVIGMPLRTAWTRTMTDFLRQQFDYKGD